MRSNSPNLKFLDDLAKVASGAVQSLGDLRAQVKTMVGGFLNEMDIVTREEFERVEALAQKARERQVELEKRLAVLEKSLKEKSSKSGKKKNMIGVSLDLAQDDNNPLDMIEELAEHKRWTFSRISDTSINLTLPGQTSKFDVSMEWQEEFSALLVACSLPLEILEANHEMAAQALEKINQNLWLGHFDLSNKGRYPTFRHTLLLRMIPSGIAIDIIADVFDIAIAECNRFYTTFLLMRSGDIRLNDDLNAAVFETIGEA